MTHEELYEHAIKRLSQFRLGNRSVIDEINASMRTISEFELNSIIRKMMDQFRRINSLHAELAKVQIGVSSPMLELARQASLSISQIASSSDISEIAKQAASVSEFWREQVEPFGATLASVNASQLAFHTQLAKISEISILSQRSLSQIPFQQIGRALNLGETARNSFSQIQRHFSESYCQLFKSLEQERQRIISLPPAISYLPAVEFYTGSRVIRLISRPEIDVYREEDAIVGELSSETNDIVETYLHGINPGLVKLWHGASQALESDNPDSVRHFMTSLRELLTQVIHILSPDDQVRRWSTSPDHYHNNKLTRRARLLFICREINYEPFDQFLEKDIDSVLACFDLFERGTHEVRSSFIKTQLQAIKLRTESAIRFLLDIGRKTGGAQ